jgi:hypothetical protein
MYHLNGIAPEIARIEKRSELGLSSTIHHADGLRSGADAGLDRSGWFDPPRVADLLHAEVAQQKP